MSKGVGAKNDLTQRGSKHILTATHITDVIAYKRCTVSHQLSTPRGRLDTWIHEGRGKRKMKGHLTNEEKRHPPDAKSALKATKKGGGRGCVLEIVEEEDSIA